MKKAQQKKILKSPRLNHTQKKQNVLYVQRMNSN